jgi:hypothetical protein
MPTSKVEYIKDEGLREMKKRVKRDPDLRRKMGVALGFITEDDPMASKFQGEVADAMLLHGTLPSADRLRELWSEIDDDYV